MGILPTTYILPATYILEVPELRIDELTGRVVLLAPARAARPHTVDAEASPAADPPVACPFCAGNEHDTPPEVARHGPGQPDTDGWQVRVVPNLYPIVGGPDAGPGADGVHEVVVLSPAHDATFGQLDDEAAIAVLVMLRERCRVHAAAGRAHVQVLINQGRAAGASIAHPHAQVLALDLVGPAVRTEMALVGDAGRDLVAADQHEAQRREQHVLEQGPARVWCPSVASGPFEMRLAVLPDAAHPDIAHQDAAHLATASDDDLAATAIALRDALRGLGPAIGADERTLAYNVVLHQAPHEDSVPAPARWWFEVRPRVTVVAGFEIGTGILVNTLDPGWAAAGLRGEQTSEDQAREDQAREEQTR